MNRKPVRVLKRGAAATLLSGMILINYAQPITAADRDGAWAQLQIEGILDQTAEVYGTEASKLLEKGGLTAGDSVSDWLAFAAAESGIAADTDSYLESLQTLVTQKYESLGGLDGNRATEWHRTTIVAKALGADPTSFGENKDGEPVDLVRDGTYGWQMSESLGTQGINGYIYALLALDCGAFEVPDGAAITRTSIISEIAKLQNADGSFGLSAGASDIDLTAMVLQALAPYETAADSYETLDGSTKTVSQIISDALSYLSGQQTARGTFSNGEVENAESGAQVIIALCSLGIDPCSDARFVKDGGNALDGLLLFRTSDGGYCHAQGEDAELMPDSQAALAFLSYQKLKNGEGKLYDLKDHKVTFTGAGSEGPGAPIALIAGGAVAAAAVIAGGIIIVRKRGKQAA